MLVERNTISQKRFIATSLVLLINLLIFQELDLVLHSSDLLVQVEDDVIVNGFCLATFFLALCQRLDFVSRLLQVRVSLEFFVNNRACRSLVDVIIARCVFYIACCSSSTAASCSSYSA